TQYNYPHRSSCLVFFLLVRYAVLAARFPYTTLFRSEPDRGTQFVNLAPRLLMNLADIPASGLLGPGSRVRHHLLVAVEPGVVKADRKSTRLNSSHVKISYAVFCLKKKNTTII